MKKLLTLAAVLGTASLSFGQGYVSFSAGATTSTRVSTNGVAVAGSASPIWYYALFAAPSTTSNGTNATTNFDPTKTGWTVVAYGTNTASSGRLNGNTTTDAAVQIPGYPGGSSTADFAVAGWSANIGTDWASVQRFFGDAPLFSQSSHDVGTMAGVGGWYGLAGLTANDVPVAPPGGPYNGLFGTAPGLIQGFSLGQINPVPEPSTFALAGLGAAALVIFRRRRA